MKKDKIISFLKIFILIIVLTSLVVFIVEEGKYVVILTQLSPQGSRQMMGYILKTADGKVIAIDSGTKDDTVNLIKNINENGGKVDYWFLTHAHDDHVGAFTNIVNNTDIPIGKIYVSVNELSWYEENEPERKEFTKEFLETLQNERIKDDVIEPKIGNKIDISENIKAEILKIKSPEITENPGNEQSMVIKFYIGNATMLILGDTGINSSKYLLENQKDKLKSDIVQMAHHGQNGATKELYEQINPKICLWPTPEWLWNNDPGTGYNTGTWKTLETREWMEELKVNRNYVAKDGDIKIKIK